MLARRGLSRTLVLLCAALQLALPGVAALADGLASRTSVHATAHVESGTERDCVRVHETDWVFCQFLATSASLSAGVSLALPAVVLLPAGYPKNETPRAVVLRGDGDPRGPPRAESV
jgi:hypothetical protein